MAGRIDQGGGRDLVAARNAPGPAIAAGANALVEVVAQSVDDHSFGLADRTEDSGLVAAAAPRLGLTLYVDFIRAGCGDVLADLI